MTEVINNILFLAINLVMALYHYELIRANKKVKHGLWSFIYFLVLIPFGILFNWWYILIGVFLRGWFFSPALNLIRGYGWNYWSLTSSSVIDKTEREVFKEFWIARLYYFLSWIVTIIFEINVGT